MYASCMPLHTPPYESTRCIHMSYILFHTHFSQPVFHCRFLYCSKLWGSTTSIINKMLSDHLQNAPQDRLTDEDTLQIIGHIIEGEIHSKKDKFLCLSSISNLHILQYPDGAGWLIDPQGHIGYKQHILHNPGEHNIPTSPRNRLMYYITKESSSAPALLVKWYLSLDQKSTNSEIEMDEVQQEPIICRKKRRHQKRNCFSYTERFDPRMW